MASPRAVPRRRASGARDPAGRPASDPATSLATGRIVAAYGHQLLVQVDGAGVRAGTRRGRRGDGVVGDRVRCAAAGSDAVVVEAIEPRRSLLYRADTFREKALAANVDRMVLVFAPQPAYHLQFLWRALVAARAAGIAPLVLMNKAELADDASRADLAALGRLGVDTLAVSARTDPAGTRAALVARLAGQANLLVGQSGMGKSTLLNLLVPDAQARTQDWSRRLNVGRQTTTASRWFDLAEPGSVVDTPGFQAFGLAHLTPAELVASLPDFAAVTAPCRFADCRHDAEPGCAVRAAVAEGRIAPRRHAFYLEVLHELRTGREAYA